MAQGGGTLQQEVVDVLEGYNDGPMPDFGGC